MTNMKCKSLFFFQIVLITVLMLGLTSCESKKSDNPLLDTQWSGLAKIPQETEVVLKFSKDKLDVLLGDKVIENMNYSLNNGEITIVKNSGGTPCNAGTTGKYKYEIIGENLVMTFISDECTARIKSLQGVIYKKHEVKK
ncbi:MAG TPA: hypothetical protein VF455_10675 [Chryseobacterium sp.]